MCCCKNFGRRIVSFALALTLGLLAANLLREEISIEKIRDDVKPVEPVGIGYGRGDGQSVEPASDGALKILSKPQAKYTEAARKNEVQGMIRLKVVFLADGRIGDISPESELPDGLTETAIEAAKQIRFDPPRKNGVPYSVTQTVVYTFTIY